VRAHAVSGDDAPLNLIINPIDIGQLNNSNRKTRNWSIRYGIDQLNSPIDQSLVLMVTMKHNRPYKLNSDGSATDSLETCGLWAIQGNYYQH
jgi:hypothetical protein